MTIHKPIEEIKEEREEEKEIPEDYYPPEWKSLPALKPNTNISVWKILKDMIGKDMTWFCVPVYFNEPITMLQKVAETFDGEYLLE